jgi:hypothetical protein
MALPAHQGCWSKRAIGLVVSIRIAQHDRRSHAMDWLHMMATLHLFREML